MSVIIKLEYYGVKADIVIFGRARSGGFGSIRGFGGLREIWIS